MIKEIAMGIGGGVLVYLAILGYDVLPLVLVGALLYIVFDVSVSKGLRHRFVPFSKSDGGGTTFSDVGGQQTAINELMECLDFLKNIGRAKALGIRPIKGILLSGPPGTGKTLLARAAATYTDSVFIPTSGSEFIEVYAGVGAQRVRQLFRKARELARNQGKGSAIIFIDEIEVLGGRRGQHASHLEYDQTLNQLLVEMDGLSADDAVRILVVGATNRADLLDPALLRPGRFDRIVKVELPDREGREQILRLHLRNKPLALDVDLGKIARETFGFSGAHLESLANEAAILALRDNQTEIKQQHLEEAIDKVIMGEKMERRPKPEELRRVAVHETGHAIVAERIRPGTVSSVTIAPRGGSLGYVRQLPADDSYLHSREYMEDEIAILLAGAIAEEQVFGSRSTGSAQDFERAVQVAKQMVFMGMSHLGIVDQETVGQERLGRGVSDIISFQERRVKDMLRTCGPLLAKVSEILLENERIPGETIRSLANAFAAEQDEQRQAPGPLFWHRTPGKHFQRLFENSQPQT